MKTAKKLLSLFLCLVILLGMLPAAYAEADPGEGTIQGVDETEDSGTISPVGNTDADNSDEGDDPDAPAVTRMQWISLLVSTFSMTVDADNYPDNYYSDISASDEGYRDLMVAVEFGVVDLEAGEPFRPDDPATRDFAASTLYFCLGFQPEEDAVVTLPDELDDPYAAQLAVDRGWFALIDGRFAPESPITLAEKDTMLADAAQILTGDEIDLNHENKAAFADSVIVFPMGTAVEDEGELLRIYDTSVSLKAGDIFAVYYGELPIVMKALSVERKSGFYEVSATTDGTEDAVLDIDYEGLVPADLTGFEPSPAQSFVTADGVLVEVEATTYTVTNAKGSTAQKQINLDKVFNIGGLSTHVVANMSNIYLETKVNQSKKDFVIKLHGDTYLHTSVSGSLTGLGADGTLEIGSIPFLYGMGSLALALEYDIEGTLSLTWQGVLIAGVSYSKGSGFRLIKSFTKNSFSVSADVTAKLGMRASASVDIKVMYTSIWASLGGVARIKEAYYDTGSPNHCRNLEGWMYAKVGAYASVPHVKSYSVTEEIYTARNSPIRVHYHWEDGQFVPVCTRGDDFKTKTGSDPGNYYTDPGSRYFNPGARDAESSYTGANGEPVVIWTYTLDKEEKATITGYKGGAASIRVPATIDGYTVVAIGNDAFKNNKVIGSVVVSDTITSIGNSAFEGCSGLRLIEMPDSVEIIGNYAFASTSLTDLTLSKSLKSLGFFVVSQTKGVTSLTIPKTLEKVNSTWNYGDGNNGDAGPLGGSYIEELIFEDGITAIPGYLAAYARYLTKVQLPDTVTSIGPCAFRYCDALPYIVIPQNVITIGDSAFDNCTSIKQLDIPDSVTKIGSYAFANMGLTGLTLPKYIKSLGAFFLSGTKGVTYLMVPKSLVSVEVKWNYGDGNNGNSGPLGGSYIEELVFEEGLTEIPGHMAAYARHMTKVSIPDTVTKIGSSAFRYCDSLTEITIPDSVVTIEGSAFEITALTSLSLPKNLTSLGTFVLKGTKGVTSLTIPKSLKKVDSTWNYDDGNNGSAGPLGDSYVEELVFEDGLKEIPGYMASYARHLRNVSIPDSVSVIGTNAFRYCDALEEISLSDQVTEIGGSAFAVTALVSVIVPDSVSVMGNYVFNSCEALKSAKLPSNRETIEEGTFQGCISLEAITIPELTKEIRGAAFKNCDSLTTVEIPSKVTIVRDNAFADCDALASVSIPDSVTSLGSSVFSNCDALTAVTIPDSVASLGSQIFYDCDALKDVKLGKGITAIPDSAFEHCDVLESIVLPYRVSSIGAKAFKDCVLFKEITIPRATTTISTDSFSYYDKLTIYGVPGTYAETYANDNSIKFVGREVNAASVTLSETTLQLYKGKSAKLSFTVDPENFTDAVSWKSGNTSVATIAEDGTVKALAVGTATIKLVVGSKSASCKVTVVQPVTSISLNRSTATLEALETVQLTARVNPSDAYLQTYRWSSSDETVAAVDENGLVTALKKGTATIMATALDGNGASAKCTVTVTNSAVICATPEELESEHDYADNFGDFWFYRAEGAAKLLLTFDERTEIEDEFDFLYIFDGAGNQIGKYTGTALAGQTVEVPGNSVKLRLVSDDSGSAWGFKVTKVEAVPLTPPVPGDANSDGTADVLDLVRFLKYLAGEPVNIDPATADLDGDGNVTSLDLMLFRKLLVGEPA